MENQFNLRTVNVTRYITPLREGGSLPALADADDDFKYVLKFKGAGHGVKALIAELIGGEVARAIGLPVPELVFANLDEAFGRTEGDEEITKKSDHILRIPRAHPLLTPILSVIPLQLLAYHIAVWRGADVDQPRNLAKSVTVE